MSVRILTETPFDIAPDSTSAFRIYDVDDQYIQANATDSIQKYDGDSFIGLKGDPPNGNILAVYKYRLMVAGDTSFPHRIWYSHIRNGEGWSKDTDWIDVYPEDGGKINGLGIQDDELIISKDNGRLYGWLIYEDGRPENSRLRMVEDDKGFVNQKSRTVMDNVLYYLDRERIDSVPVLARGGVSYIVQDVIDGIKNFDNTSMGSNDGKVYAALGDISIEIGDTIELDDAVLVYDTINQAFYLRDGINAKVFSKFVETDGQEELYFGDTTGRVYKVNDGNLAGANPIHMRVRTKPYFRELGVNVDIKKVGIFMDDPDGTVVNYRTSLNQAFVKNLGVVTKEPVQWFDKQISGPLLQLELTHSNTDSRPRLLAIEINYETRGKSE